jgi:hypothetical protein
MGKRILILLLFFFNVCLSYAQVNLIPLRHLRFAPGDNYVVASDPTGRLYHMPIDSINYRQYLPPWDTSATSYTLQLQDARRGIVLTSSSDITIEVPLNSTVSFPVGQVITILRKGTGEVTITGAGGVTLLSANNHARINARYQTAQIWQIAVNEWVFYGDLKN